MYMCTCACGSQRRASWAVLSGTICLYLKMEPPPTILEFTEQVSRPGCLASEAQHPPATAPPQCLGLQTLCKSPRDSAQVPVLTKQTFYQPQPQNW